MGASGIWLDSPLKVKDTSGQIICGNSAIRGLLNPKTTGVRSSDGKKILPEGCGKTKKLLSAKRTCLHCAYSSMV